MGSKRLSTPGACVDHSLSLATEEWYRQHGGMRDREEAFANGLKSISASMELRPGGCLVIHCVLTARRSRQNLVEYERFQREAGKGYVRVLAR